MTDVYRKMVLNIRARKGGNHYFPLVAEIKSGIFLRYIIERIYGGGVQRHLGGSVG